MRQYRSGRATGRWPWWGLWRNPIAVHRLRCAPFELLQEIIDLYFNWIWCAVHCWFTSLCCLPYELFAYDFCFAMSHLVGRRTHSHNQYSDGAEELYRYLTLFPINNHWFVRKISTSNWIYFFLMQYTKQNTDKISVDVNRGRCQYKIFWANWNQMNMNSTHTIRPSHDFRPSADIFTSVLVVVFRWLSPSTCVIKAKAYTIWNGSLCHPHASGNLLWEMLASVCMCVVCVSSCAVEAFDGENR